MARTKKKKKPAATTPPVISPMKKFIVVHPESGLRAVVELDETQETNPARRAMHLGLISIQTEWKGGGGFPDWEACRLEEDGKLVKVPY